ncbi:MAG: zf-HC2 domain-containing protein [Planctomycetota bacterium]|nr:zf-HC2 domain-containing protein [Planctomycetota bacterium]
MNKELLYAYLDGELNPEEAARLEARLAADSTLAEELAALRQVDAALDALPGHEVSDDFTERVAAAARPRRGILLRLGLPLAAAAALALAVFLPSDEPPVVSSDPFSTEEYIDYVWEADAETYGSLSLNELEGQILEELG